MDRWVVYSLILLSNHFLSPGHTKELNHKKEQLQLTSSISITQKDITTPLTTIPTIIPTTSTSSNPVVIPTSTPESISPVMTTPKTTFSSVSSGASWCIASQSASQTALLVALDYACSYGRSDCSEIQPGGSCYFPNTARDHASYAFNNYYQKNPVPNSCNFGGIAVITNTDPSTGTCMYPFTSTNSSVLDTTNSSGSTVFGAGVPSSPSTSAADTSRGFNYIFQHIIIPISITKMMINFR